MGKIKNVIPYPEEDFVEALYMAVQKMKLFAKSCAKWKRKPAPDYATEAQARTYFKEAHEIYDEECISLHEMGVANNAVIQEKMDKCANEASYGRQSS